MNAEEGADATRSIDAANAINAARHFIGKWQAREPEMRLAEIFCPKPLKARFLAWGALLHELREAAFELSDARITGVKTLWWAEELAGLAQGRHRHPLAALLADTSAPWSSLGRALVEQVQHDGRAVDTNEAISLLLPLARSVVSVEAALFGAVANEDQARSVAIHWLLHRLPEGLAAEDQARLPMHLLARYGITAAQVATGQGEPMLRDWAGELLLAVPEKLGAAVQLRRARHGFDRARLVRIAAGKGFSAPPGLPSLWRAWMSARALPQ